MMGGCRFWLSSPALLKFLLASSNDSPINNALITMDQTKGVYSDKL